MGNHFCQCTVNENNSFFSPQKLESYQKLLRQFSDIYSPQTLGLEETNVQCSLSKFNTINFEPQKFLGSGCFGKVIAVKKISDSKEKVFALKIIDKNVVRQKMLLHSNTHLHNIVTKNNPFLVSVYEIFQNQRKIFILMENISAGDLLFYIKKSNGFNESVIKQIASEILFGLKLIHKQGVIFRGLKAQNILVSNDGHIKLTDYWCSKTINQANKCQNFSGIIQYSAPEILKNQTYDQTSDLWSFGILLYQMKYGKTPFNKANNSEQHIRNSILQGLYQVDQKCSQQFKDLITRLLSQDPSDRGTIEEIQSHSFFDGINWNSVSQRCNQPLLQNIVKKHNIRPQRSSYIKPERIFKLPQTISQHTIYQINYYLSH